MENKFAEEYRTFETRLLFIKSIFENLYPKDQIMTSCINYKLGKSFDNYEDILNYSSYNINCEDPLKILSKL